MTQATKKKIPRNVENTVKNVAKASPRNKAPGGPKAKASPRNKTVAGSPSLCERLSGKLPYEGAKHTIDEQDAYIRSNHQGLGFHATQCGVFVNALLHMLAYVPTVLCFLGIILGGGWTWLTFVAGWVLVPLFDLII